MKKSLVWLATCSLFMVAPAMAQSKFPERPITIVVPSAPGGTTDFSARFNCGTFVASFGTTRGH
jgi:tripartite-type tricarboxylate transporter receptor subunit TctC